MKPFFRWRPRVAALACASLVSQIVMAQTIEDRSVPGSPIKDIQIKCDHGRLVMMKYLRYHTREPEAVLCMTVQGESNLQNCPRVAHDQVNEQVKAFGARLCAVRTEFVPATHEAIPEPFPTIHNLPKALSIDPMTDAEIQLIRQQIFEVIELKTPRRVEGIDGCMQWFFMRHDPKQRWQAFGFAERESGVAMAKLNGAMRATVFSYSIASEPVRSLLSVLGTLYGPGTKPGGGGMWMQSFAGKTSIRELRATSEADRSRAHDMGMGILGPDARYLTFGRTNVLKVSRPEAACTLLRARCRQYVFPVNGAAEWIGSIMRNPANVDADHFHEPIDMARGLKLEIAIEDMCPFSRDALVESAVNTRVGGAEPGVRKYGIRNNASLKEALAPYVQRSKR